MKRLVTILNIITKNMFRFFGRGSSLLSLSHNVSPKGGTKSLEFYDAITCVNKSGIRTRLTYLVDKNEKPWFKTERLDTNGKIISENQLKPATMTFEEQSLQLM